MPESAFQELPASTSISPEYALELRVKALEEQIRRLEEQRLLQELEVVNKVEQQLARRLRLTAGVFSTSSGGRP